MRVFCALLVVAICAGCATYDDRVVRSQWGQMGAMLGQRGATGLVSAGVRRWDVRQIGEKRLATGKVAGQSWRRRIYKFPTARTRERCQCSPSELLI